MKTPQELHYVASRAAVVSRETTLLKTEGKLGLPLCTGEISDGETEAEDAKSVVSW